MRTAPQLSAVTAADRRGGAVIILSLALLMTLLFLGLFFFSFIDDEALSATIYAKQFTGDDPYLDSAAVLDFGLRQVIVSTNSTDQTTPGVMEYYSPYSALTESRFSLLAHILGRMNDDGTPMRWEPYSGAGIRVWNNGGTLQADTNGDGNAEVTSLSGGLRLNASPLADGGSVSTVTDFDPNAGYTYPDLNALFLAHHSIDPVTGNLIIKPSYDATGLLYQEAGLDTKERVLRIHSGHQYSSGERYLTAATTALSGDTSRLIPPFETAYLTDPTNMGVYTGSGSTYDLPIDADGDGQVDSFLIDLDHPLITFSDGRQGVPMFFWRIEDADALVNLNTAGDMPVYRVAERRGDSRNQVLNALYNDGRYLTGGNYGFSPSEINPGVALKCDPDPSDGSYVNGANQALALDQYQRFFSEQAGIGSASMDRTVLANTELLWLLIGRHTYDSAGNPRPADQNVVGRYGEPQGIPKTASLMAAAGTTGSDDDRDDNTHTINTNGGRPAGGRPYSETFPWRNRTQQTVPTGVVVPPAVHPLDTNGYGVSLTPQGALGMKRILRSSNDANNPSQWLYYAGTSVPQFGMGVQLPLWQFQVAGGAGVSPWVSAVSLGYLQAHDPANPLDALHDEPDELIVDDSDASFPNPDDQPFAASEMAALHASDADWALMSKSSRLRKLAPVNFEINYRAQEIRRQFTTISWDRPEFGFALDNIRNWEWNTNSNQFPPKFNGAGVTLPNYPTTGTIVAADPIRPELRKLLYVNFDTSAVSDQDLRQRIQHRLQLNGILSDDSLNGIGGEACFDTNGNPRFRPLVPHPVFVSGDTPFTPSPMVHSNTASPPFPLTVIGSNKAAQEWWARYDRQRLARDIYTLLWVVGAKPGLNPVASNPYTVANGYPDNNGNGTPDVIEEMAQFAVNMVDAMDHDHVITRFEYDPDLSDGWDTNQYDNGMLSTLQLAYGVEAQALTFSEALWLRTHIDDGSGNPADHLATLYDDAAGDKHFLFMELRNALPLNVTLGRDTYRIRRFEGAAPVADLTLQDGSLTIGAGENFVIGTHSGGINVVGGTNDGRNQAAIFWLDDAHDQSNSSNLSYTAFAPFLPPVGGAPSGTDPAAARQAYPSPLCDLDLCHDRDRVTTQKFVEAGNGVGYFLSTLAAAMTPPNSFTLVLERRQNLQGDGVINTAGNDWVEIDRVTVRRRDLELTNSDLAATVQNTLRTNVVSQERREPFYAHVNPVAAAGLSMNQSQSGDGLADYGSQTGGSYPLNNYIRHSLGGPSYLDNAATSLSAVTAANASLKHQRNSVQPDATQFQIWQPHFDRGFTSVYDLLSVPLLRPWELVFIADRTAGGLVHADSTSMTGIHAAAVRFLHPEPNLTTQLSGLVPPGSHYENRWYRLFEFLCMPSHTSDEVADDMTLRRRIPGRMNLNTIRTEHALGALLNDADQLELGLDPTKAATQDKFTPARNWYDEMRRTRDGDAGGGNIHPPGTPYAKPFRPLTFDDRINWSNPLDPTNGRDPLGHTLLRRGTNTALTNFNQMGLFEARNPADLTGSPADQIDWHTKQRILSRIANLTTNRSHVFVIWGGFQMHEAHELSAGGDVQIGARMTDIPVYRELIIVDMSRMEEAFDGTRFQFAPFILHREVLP